MSKHTSVIAAFALAGALWTAPARGDAANVQTTNAWRHLVGSWQVTSAQTSLILSIEPDHEVLVLWIRPGSHSMLRTSWKAMPGGVLVQGIPRVRIWKGRDGRDDELRAELEVIPELGYDPNRGFHDHFFMRRIRDEDVPQPWLDRPLPARWQVDTLGEEWNETAGRKPLPENATKAEQAATADVADSAAE